MKVYLDSSAIVKLVKRERESKALMRYLRKNMADAKVTSALARVEVVRAVASGGPTAVAHARRQLARINQVNLDRRLLDTAATMVPATILRSLDAIHLASALSIGADLRAVVTYDRRMSDAATSLGLGVESPG